MARYRDANAKADPELERLAREGRAARAQASGAAADDAKVAGDRHLREALAALHGAAPSSVALKLVGGFLLMAAVVMALLHESVHPMVGVLTFFVGIVVSVVASISAPRATDEALEAERTWYRGLPFELDGYFAVLSAEPRPSGGVRAHITWRSDVAEAGNVDEQLVADAFAVADPAARLESADSAGAVFVSGPITGLTGSTINRRPVVRNHRYPEYLHTLVDKVLVPLSRSRPIERVRLEPM